MNGRVLISGGSGMVGRAITQLLVAQGYEVGWLSRSAKKGPSGVHIFVWNPEQNTLDAKAIHWPDFVINLAGESIGNTPWNSEGKRKILESRLAAVQTLVAGFRQRSVPLKGFVGASAIGFYGPGDQNFKESDGPGSDFPARVSVAWEAAYQSVTPQMCHRKAILRLAVVLSASGGALPQIIRPIQWYAGTILGTGRQPFTWIHIHDAAEAFAQALFWNGTYNLAATQPSTNEELTKMLAKILNKPLWWPNAPAWALRLVLGERSTLVLDGNRVDVSALMATGYAHRFPLLNQALHNLLPKPL